MVDFSRVDSEFKAYFLGLVSADGCIQKHKDRPNTYRITLSLWDTDLEILQKIRDIINPEINIYTSGSKIKGRHDMKILQVSDSKLCQQLIGHGVTERKAHTLKPCLSVPANLLHHYVRGIMDGDGCVSIDKTKMRPVCAIYGTEEIIEYIKESFLSVYKNKTNVRKDKGCYSIHYCGNTAHNFLNWVYTESTIFMKRKYLKYLETKNPMYVYSKESKRPKGFKETWGCS